VDDLLQAYTEVGTTYWDLYQVFYSYDDPVGW